MTNEPKTKRPARRSRKFMTQEEAAARAGRGAEVYLWVDHPLCRSFLELGREAQHFTAVQVFFPFVREAALARLPLAQGHLADWLFFSFLAGWDMGGHHPELRDAILAGDEAEATRQRLETVRQLAGEVKLTAAGLTHAMKEVVAAKWPDVPDAEIVAVHAVGALKTMRAGFLAAVTREEGQSPEAVVGQIPPRCTELLRDVLWRALVGAPAAAFGRPLADRLEHPLLRLAREKYPAQPKERTAALELLQERLRRHGVDSEHQCVTGRQTLPYWIAAGLHHGQKMLRERPQAVQEIFAESSEERLQDSLGVVRQVVAEVGSVAPERLLPRLETWQQRVYGWQQPGFYGRALAQIVYLVDFAMWVPWVMAADRGDNPEMVRPRGQPSR